MVLSLLPRLLRRAPTISDCFQRAVPAPLPSPPAALPEGASPAEVVMVASRSTAATLVAVSTVRLVAILTDHAVTPPDTEEGSADACRALHDAAASRGRVVLPAIRIVLEWACRRTTLATATTLATGDGASIDRSDGSGSGSTATDSSARWMQRVLVEPVCPLLLARCGVHTLQQPWCSNQGRTDAAAIIAWVVKHGGQGKQTRSVDTADDDVSGRPMAAAAEATPGTAADAGDAGDVAAATTPLPSPQPQQPASRPPSRAHPADAAKNASRVYGNYFQRAVEILTPNLGTAVSSQFGMVWLVQAVQYPSLGPLLSSAVPPLLRMIDHHSMQSRVLGLRVSAPITTLILILCLISFS